MSRMHGAAAVAALVLAGFVAIAPARAEGPAAMPAPAGNAHHEVAPPPASTAVPADAPSSPAATPAPGGASAPAAGTAEPPAVAEPSATVSGDAAAVATPVVPEAPAHAAPALPHDLSPVGMFLAADWVVKAVMIGLALASVITWTVWIVKSFELAFARRAVARALAALRAAPSLEVAARALEDGPGRNAGPAAKVVQTALAEWRISGNLPAEGIKERVIIALNRIEAGAGRRLAVGTGVLASIGSVAPFVGLFGTVWGIMNSFIGISKAQTTNLAVVAPGIAEALLATALGLVAAIPAVVIYNVFARSISGYKAALADTSAEALRHLSRDLDRAAAEGETVRLRAAAE